MQAVPALVKRTHSQIRAAILSRAPRQASSDIRPSPPPPAALLRFALALLIWAFLMLWCRFCCLKFFFVCLGWRFASRRGSCPRFFSSPLRARPSFVALPAKPCSTDGGNMRKGLDDKSAALFTSPRRLLLALLRGTVVVVLGGGVFPPAALPPALPRCSAAVAEMGTSTLFGSGRFVIGLVL